MRIVRSVVVDCHIEDVSAYVADPANDPAWCVGSRTRVAAAAPARVTWQEAGAEVTLELEEVWTSTRVTHREDSDLGALRRAARAREVARRLRALRRALERR
jgi:hypothetical protein